VQVGAEGLCMGPSTGRARRRVGGVVCVTAANPCWDMRAKEVVTVTSSSSQERSNLKAVLHHSKGGVQ
jgi:hypothetical protein